MIEKSFTVVDTDGAQYDLTKAVHVIAPESLLLSTGSGFRVVAVVRSGNVISVKDARILCSDGWIVPTND